MITTNLSTLLLWQHVVSESKVHNGTGFQLLAIFTGSMFTFAGRQCQSLWDFKVIGTRKYAMVCCMSRRKIADLKKAAEDRIV